MNRLSNTAMMMATTSIQEILPFFWLFITVYGSQIYKIFTLPALYYSVYVMNCLKEKEYWRIYYQQTN